MVLQATDIVPAREARTLDMGSDTLPDAEAATLYLFGEVRPRRSLYGKLITRVSKR